MAVKDSYKFAIVKQPEPPWTLVHCITENNSTSGLEFLRKCNGKYGAAVDVTILLAEYLKWNISFAWTNIWGSFINGTWVGAVGEVMRHETDSCIPQVSPNFERVQAVDFAGYLFIEQKACFAFCHNGHYDITFELSKLFKHPLIVAVLLCLTVLAFGVTFLILGLKTQSPKEALQKMVALLLQAICGIQTHFSKSAGFREKFLQALFGLFILIFLRGFISSKLLSSFVAETPVPFKDICDLARKMKRGELSIIFQNNGLFAKTMRKRHRCFQEAEIANPGSVMYNTDGHGIKNIIDNQQVVLYHYKAFTKWELSNFIAKNRISNVECTFEYLCENAGWPDGFIVAKDKPILYETMVRASKHLREFGFVKTIEKYYKMEEEKVELVKVPITRQPD